MTMTLEMASDLAEHAHRGQHDKAGRPYVEHVFAVRDLLAEHGEHAQMAGVLHDVLEDTPLTADELRRHGCPDEVVAVVESVTRRRGEPYEETIHRAAAHPLGRLVKLADNAHNSDEDRLAALPAEQAERLRDKYARAREVLEDAAPIPGHDPVTHDYGPGNRHWGHDYSFTPADGGHRGSATGWGRGIHKGDYLLLANGDRATRYRVVTIRYYTDPSDMWQAQLAFAPRERVQA